MAGASSVLDILVRARDEASATLERVSGAVQGVGGRVQALSDRLASVGSAMTRTLTPAAAGVALAMGRIASSWNEAQRTLRLGNTEAQFRALMESATRVAGRVAQPFEQVAAAVDELSDRTGLAGPRLERLARRFLQLEHITGEAASTTIPAVTRLFGDWGVKTRDQTEVLDQLMRASEATGAEISQLAQLTVQFGSPLRQLGFSLSETVAMFAKWEQEGVNITTAMPGLRMALKNLAAPSDELAKTLRKVGVTAREPKEALGQLMDAIKDAPSTTEAVGLAIEVFGARAGPDLAAAIREGRFDFRDLVSEIEDGRATIADAAKRSTTLADRLAMLRNRIVGAIGPYAELVGAIASGVAAAGPAVLGISQIISVLGKLRLATLASVGIWALVAAAVVAVVVVIVRNWDKVKAFLLKVWGAIRSAAVKVWGAIKAAALAIWDAIRAPVLAYLGFWRGALGKVLEVARATWSTISGVVRSAFAAVRSAASAVFGWLRGAFRGVAEVGRGIWEGILAAARSVFNAVATAWNSTVGRLSFRVPDWVPLIGGRGFDVPDIPLLASGGVVTRPTLAVLGEAGPEAVVPLRRGLAPVRVDVRLVVDRRRFVGATDVEYVWGGRW